MMKVIRAFFFTRNPRHSCGGKVHLYKLLKTNSYKLEAREAAPDFLPEYQIQDARMLCGSPFFRAKCAQGVPTASNMVRALLPLLILLPRLRRQSWKDRPARRKIYQ